MSLPTSPQGNGAGARASWQEQLQGGRTAWSSTVTVQGQNIAARYWYDGQYINNAKEDAAEVALKTLNQQPRSSTVYPGQLFPQQSASYGRGTGGF
ncbi:hypothetical protein N7539_006797 [Penicillium diatomitis]|uniref:Uncharacterized protein n=1 Tax=Penicillium diatomitis TaxID=2819901 RepID=A0A9W9X1V8_9EURO|nr:uncharacterized protein N7539_006797 [Penicillium diatomitis]KAJ5480903.1 hypothetical protein N7539_006797 [Penicillium diatomitis]